MAYGNNPGNQKCSNDEEYLERIFQQLKGIASEARTVHRSKGHWDPAVEGGKVSIVLLNQFNQNVKDDPENCKYQLDRSRNN